MAATFEFIQKGGLSFQCDLKVPWNIRVGQQIVAIMNCASWHICLE
jgi:hypothetical protein